MAAQRRAHPAKGARMLRTISFVLLLSTIAVGSATAAVKDSVDDSELGAAPISLTASDGTGLRLLSLRARGVVEGPLAFTELWLTFQNPRAQTLEGRFAITLPPGASVSRFAMRQETGWQEG